MKIEVSEKDLIYLLHCADDNANFDEFEKGFVNEAKETRNKVRSMIFNINHQLGFEKYVYDNEFGIQLVQ